MSGGGQGQNSEEGHLWTGVGIIRAPYHTKAPAAYHEDTSVRCLVWGPIRIMQPLVHGPDGARREGMVPTPRTIGLVSHGQPSQANSKQTAPGAGVCLP